jgi:hypothetical protein
MSESVHAAPEPDHGDNNQDDDGGSAAEQAEQEQGKQENTGQESPT